MKNKLLLFLLVSSLISTPVFSQQNQESGITGGISRFFLWISNIDKVLFGIDNKETLYSIDRNLGYTSFYIDQIAQEKLLLAKEINDLKNDKDDDKHFSSLDKRIVTIKDDIDDLTLYLNRIKGNLSQTNQKEIDTIILEISKNFQNRKLHLLKEIRDAIYTKNIPYDKILKEAQEAKKIADSALLQVKIAKNKIREVLNK